MKRAAADLGRRAAGYFIAPQVTSFVATPQPARPQQAPAPPAVHLPPRVAVLGRRDHAVPIAGAIANALRAQERSPSAAVAVWAPAAPHPGETPPLARATPQPPDPAPLVVATSPSGGGVPPLALATSATADHTARPPATPAAARLTVRLSGRGLAATARGRVAWVALPDHVVAATLTARRLSGATDAPVVTVLAGPRTEVLEGLLREQDLVVVVAPDPGGALARLAVASCEPPAVACAPLSGPARVLAAAGFAGARVLDDRTRAALERIGEPVPFGLTPNRVPR